MKAARAWTALDERACLVLGPSMRGFELAADDRLPVRRRITGGGAVLRGPWMLRATVRLPREHPVVRLGPVHAGRWFGELHADWLRRMGVARARLYGGPVRSHWSCFAGRAPGEVLAGLGKITGISQAWRRHDVLLASGTLLSPVPWRVLCQAMGKDLREAVALDFLAVDALQCVDAVSPAEWARSLRDALDAALASLQPLEQP